MKIGIRNTTLKEEWNTAFAAAKEIGFDGVELDVGADFKETFLWNADQRREVVKLQKETGCELPCICIGGLWQHSPASPDPAVRATAEEFMKGTVEYCAEIGARVILAPINDARGQGFDAARERWLAVMANVAPVAEKHCIIVALENCGPCTAEFQRDLVDAVGCPYVRAYVDMANFLAADDDSPAAIRLLGERVAHVHAKDFAVQGDKRVNVPLGEGVIDIPGCIAALREIGYDDYVTLETPPGDDARAEAAKNLAYLKKLV